MSDFLVLFLQIIRHPHSAARLIMRLDLPATALWPYHGLVSICYGLIWFLPLYRPPPEVNPLLSGVGPVLPTVFFFAYGVSLSYVLARLGAIMGGLGGFAQALALMTYIPFMLLIPQVVFFLLIPVSFYLFACVMLLMYGYFFWITICIVDELHRFDSLGRSFMLLLFANFFAILFAGFILSSLVLLMGLTGLSLSASA